MNSTLLRVALLPIMWAAVFFGVGAFGGSSALPSSVDIDAECGRLLVDSDGAPVFHASSTRVTLALDEEWRELFGNDAGRVARSLLLQASSLFRGVDIHLLAVRVVDWSTPDGVTTARELLSVAEATIERVDADLVIALTAQPLEGADGRARRDGRYAVIEHHPGFPEKDAFVLAHEVAHLFGANHEEDSLGKAGLMTAKGFGDPELIYPCTKRALEANAALFHESLDATEQATP